MSGYRILITRPIPETGLTLLRQRCELDLRGERAPLSPAELGAAAAGADGLLCLLTDRIDAPLFAAAPSVKAVANMAVGCDNIDVAAATEHGVLVTNTPGCLTETTADLALALLLATARRIVEADRYVRGGRFERWQATTLLGRDVHGKILGVLGLGRVGKAVARRAALGFGMKVLYTSRRRDQQAERELGATRVELDELLGGADFVTVHLPLTPETRGLLDGPAIARMKPGAILINTARGPIVDEAALVAALDTGHLAGAGLDVYQNEPKLEPHLVDLDNVVLAPHIGSASIETRAKMATMAAENLLLALDGGRPPCLVNPEVLTARHD